MYEGTHIYIHTHGGRKVLIEAICPFVGTIAITLAARDADLSVESRSPKKRATASSLDPPPPPHWLSFFISIVLPGSTRNRFSPHGIPGFPSEVNPPTNPYVTIYRVLATTRSWNSCVPADPFSIWRLCWLPPSSFQGIFFCQFLGLHKKKMDILRGDWCLILREY